MYAEHVEGLTKQKRSYLYYYRNPSWICPTPAAGVKLWFQVFPPQHMPVFPVLPGSTGTQVWAHAWPPAALVISFPVFWAEVGNGIPQKREARVQEKPRAQMGAIPAGERPRHFFSCPQGPGSQTEQAGVRLCLQTGSVTSQNTVSGWSRTQTAV